MNYFKDSEFECKCGCKLNNITQELKDKLEIARGTANVPFVINSATRCVKHNTDVGGKRGSSHLYGYAVDISTIGSYMKFKILKSLILAGFERIGYGKSFIHADIDPNKSKEACWDY